MKRSKTHTRKGWDRRRFDESDFELQIEDFTEPVEKPFRVVDGRVVAVPMKTRTVQKARPGIPGISIELCFHDRPLSHRCATCEFEASKLGGGAP